MMGRRKGNGGGIGALLLGALVVVLLIPKEVWITLFLGALAALVGWVGWRLFQNWQSARQTSVLPPPPEDTGKTLAEILGESAVKNRLPAQSSAGTASDPGRPVAAQEPVRVRTNSFADDWAANRDTVAAANRARSEELRARIAASDKGHVPPGAQPLPAADVSQSNAVGRQSLEEAPSLNLHQAAWEIERDRTASENRQRAEMLRAKFPDVRIVSEESAGFSFAPKPDEGSRKRSEAADLVPPVVQAPPALPSQPIAQPPPFKSEAADSGTPAKAPPSRPVPAQDPVPVRTTSPLRALVDLASPIRQPAPPRWVSLGETVTIRGQSIAGGGFYLGTPRGYQDSRLPIIDPTLSFSGQADWRGEGLGYWPRYAGLNDRERGTLLAFLNSERRAATVGIGYVFLYFYGLEHRLLRGLAGGPNGQAEGQQILEEVQRLQQHYGHHGSFRRYSQELLAVGRFKLGLVNASVEEGDDWSLEQHVRAAQAVVRHQPLPSGLAFAWAQALTDGARSTTWDVVRPEMRTRFAQLYSQRFNEGLVIKPGRSRLALNYHWAGPGEGTETIQTDLPDITRSQAPVRPLIALVQQAMGELEALRKVRRSKNGTPIAELAAMPDALRGKQVPLTFRALVSDLDAALAQQAVSVIATSRLTQGCGMGAPDRLGKREATALIQALEALGFAIEPDVRFHGPSLTPDGQVVVFRLPDQAARTPSSAYAAALLMLQAALAVAAQGSEINQSELDVAVAAIERQFALPESERRRIEAHLRWLQLNPITLARLENRVRLLPASEREAFAGVLLEIAAADGHVSSAEVRVIERFYRALELDPARVPADLHHASVGGRPKTGAGGGLNADMIAQKLAETGRVQSVLAQIFNEAETAATVRTSSPTPSIASENAPAASLAEASSDAIPELDAEHLALLERALQVAGEQWPRADFEAACDALGLLPDGAAEMLNEAAFSVAGEPLLEGDDPLYVNDYVRAQLAQTLSDHKKPRQ